MTVEELRNELEKIVACLYSSGFGNVDAGIIKKLEQLCASAVEQGLNEGKHLIENLITVIQSIQDGKSKPESGNIRLIALEFYLGKLTGSEDTEELLDAAW